MATSKNHISMFVLPWVARSLAVFCIWIVLHFIFSLGLDLLYVAVQDMAVILLLVLGFLGGLMLAWKKEMTGGVLTLLSVTVFCLIYGYAFEVSVHQAIWILIFAAPGLLFLLHAVSSVLSESRGSPSPP